MDFDDTFFGFVAGAMLTMVGVAAFALVSVNSARNACEGATGAARCERNWVPVDDK